MGIRLQKAIFHNRAPFDHLELDFQDSNMAVLSGINGRGKTTILSHIVDAFYEMAKEAFENEFEDKKGKFYRISSTMQCVIEKKVSLVYFRFLYDEKNLDYIDIRGELEEREYDCLLQLNDKIPYSQIKDRINTNHPVHKRVAFGSLNKKELFAESSSGAGDDNPYDLTGYLTTINTDEIDADYMNSRFDKYKKALNSGKAEDVANAKEELHKTFATLTQEEQKYANIFLHDIETGDANIEAGKTLRDYISEYMQRAKNDQIHRLSTALGLNEKLLREMMSLNLNETNINGYGRLDALKATVNKQTAKAYFESLEKVNLSMPKVNAKIHELLWNFIIKGGFDL